VNLQALHLPVILIAIAIAATALAQQALAANCPDLPKCHGCGCRGGPGYRGHNGNCVSFRDLARKCGPEPTKLCKYEGLPNTGLNYECTLPHPRPRARTPLIS
jgi:hypothetical protein